MSIQYQGLNEINGPLIALEGVRGVAFDEIATIKLDDGTERTGRVVQMDGDRVMLQVFEGTKGISLKNTRTVFSGRPLEIPLAEEMLGPILRVSVMVAHKPLTLVEMVRPHYPQPFN